MIVRAGGASWLNHFATVTFNVYSAFKCCVLYTYCVNVSGMFAVM